MNTEHKSNSEDVEKPDEWWYRVYAAVIITTIAVISVLALFSKYFSA